MAAILYFAYGSNMLAERLTARCTSARVRDVVAADGYELSFSKRSQDGSGKATISVSVAPESRVYGVVFEIDEADMGKLDRLEGRGRGYDRVDSFNVATRADAAPLSVTTYVASPRSVDQKLKPYEWYLGLVLAGAKQHRLPAEYIQSLEATSSIADPDPDRAQRLQALELLRGRSAA